MATETPAIRVSSYKGTTLEAGERSGLIIGPSSTDYSVISSDPDAVAVEQVLTFWAAVAKAEGSAEITVSNSAGECGTHRFRCFHACLWLVMWSSSTAAGSHT